MVMVHPAQLIDARRLLWIAGSAVATIVRSTAPMNSAIATIPKMSRGEGPPASVGDWSGSTWRWGVKRKTFTPSGAHVARPDGSERLGQAYRPRWSSAFGD